MLQLSLKRKAGIYVMQTVSQSDIVRDLRQLGIMQGAEILVHSSLSSIGHVEGGANTVINALLEAVDPHKGTVIVPTITANAQQNPDNPPLYNVHNTPCWTGTIPETFRHRQDAVRSLNPSHSTAAIGTNAENLMIGHEDCRTPCGFGSPYYRLSRRGGKVLLLGVTLKSNTSFHMIEDLADVKFHLQPQPTECTIIDCMGKRHLRSILLHKWGTRRKYPILHQPFLELGIMREGLIGQAASLLIDAKGMVEYTEALLRKDPFYLVDRPIGSH
ncbi:MAG: hypothetical protein K0R75_3310 [Paenibacillaceae bacterium]|nr:hypothetical protein [Paenibacillaceae bacterium]